MFNLTLIGIGTGNPDHVTMQARHAIAAADLILIPHKGDEKSDLADLRTSIVAEVCPDSAPRIALFDLPVRDPSIPYIDRVNRWHDEIAAIWAETIAAHTDGDGANVALLVWGDPSLYDSTLRIAARLTPAPTIKVIPGITAIQALTASHAITLNGLANAVTVTTGRRIRDHGWPERAETVVVMLDGECSFTTLENADQIDIWWGAFLGMENELIAAGRLDQVADQIIATRAKGRADHGWIMDIYLMRRRA